MKRCGFVAAALMAANWLGSGQDAVGDASRAAGMHHWYRQSLAGVGLR